MADLTLPYTITNGTTNDATEVQGNDAAIVSWVNTNAIRKDGSIAFTAVPTGPASDPSSDNQLSRKAYVDTRTGRASGNPTSSHTLTANDTYQTIDTVTFTNPGKAVVVIAHGHCLQLGGATASDLRYQFKLQISFDNGASYTDSPQAMAHIGSGQYQTMQAFLRKAGTPTGDIKIRIQHYQQSGGISFGQAAEASIVYDIFKTTSL